MEANVISPFLLLDSSIKFCTFAQLEGTDLNQGPNTSHSEALY